MVTGEYNRFAKKKCSFNVKKVEAEPFKKMKPKQRETIYANALKFSAPEDFEHSPLKGKEKEKGIEKDELEIFDKEMFNFVVLPEKNLAVSVESVKNYKEFEKKVRRQTRKTFVKIINTQDKDAVVVPEGMSEDAGVPSNFFDKMPGFTPGFSGESLGGIERKGIPGVMRNYAPINKARMKFSDMKGYIVCGISVFSDPQDGQKYYKIVIRVGEEGLKLSATPKEIVFLVDCSSSIGKERFEEFKEGLRYCVNNLNQDDHFNIGAFKKRISWFNKGSVKLNEINKKNALNFIDGLSVKQRTDAYNALYASLKQKKIKNPSYIVFLSDGLPTYGEKDSQKIVNEISKLNNGERPIFAVTGGMRVDRYFLDFIAYKNRGWSGYTSRTHSISKQVRDVCDKIRSPLLLNLRYRVSGLDEKEIFPKNLPDFFRDVEFTLYGKYSDEKEFSLQFLGDLKGELNEFIIVGSLEDAEQGGEEIARNWAFNRIYHLIGTFEYGSENAEIIEEIKALCKKFNLKLPYAKNLGSK